MYIWRINLYNHLTSLSIKLSGGRTWRSVYEKEPAKRRGKAHHNADQITQLELIGNSFQFTEFMDCQNSFVLSNEMIENLNLQNSLTNLVIKIDFGSHRSCLPYLRRGTGRDVQKRFKTVFTKMILSLVKKEYLYHLSDIKVWFILDQRCDNDEKSSFIDWIFDIIWSKCNKVFKSTSLKKVEIFGKQEQDSQTVSIMWSPASAKKYTGHDSEKSQWKDKLFSTTDESR